MSGPERRLWWTVAFDQRSGKWIEVEHVEQTVGHYDSKAEAEKAIAGREVTLAKGWGRAPDDPPEEATS